MSAGIIALAALGLAATPVAATAGEVAIIVHQENTLRDVSFPELVKLFKQERQFWQDGKRIYLLMRESGSAEKQVLLEKLYQMDELALKKFWLGKLYRGEIPALPKTLSSNEAVKQFVNQVPNAIGYIDASFVDDGVKALRIDGKLPGEPGYVLSDSR